MHRRCRLPHRSAPGRPALVFLCNVIVGASIAMAQTAQIRLVSLPSASPSDTGTTLPASQVRFLHDASWVIEVWAQTADPRGLSSVSADIAFTHTLAGVDSITHSATFGVLTAGTINNATGTIDNLSGSHLGPCSDAVAAAPTWARVAALGVTGSAIGSLSVQSAPANSAIYGTAICGLGNVADAQIDFGSVVVDLVECLTDGECSDEQFCNGAETCNLTTFTCQPGTPPTCNDSVACTIDTCDPLASGGAGGCVYTPSDGLCDNLLFCDGVETCDAIQGCLPGTTPCTAACEHCVEDDDACALCIFDLDGSGVMGTGDFSFFAPCFGGCYPAGNPCLTSNFDGDAGGCVGTSDFAAFVGCFGSTCGQCAGCAGPGAGGMAGAPASVDFVGPTGVVVRIIATTAPATSDILDAQPRSETDFRLGEPVYLEVWTSLQGSSGARGLACAYVNVQFDVRRLALVEVVPSREFPLFVGPSVSPVKGSVSAAGGCTQLRPDGVGADGKWVRIATVTTYAISPGRSLVTTTLSDVLHGFAMAGAFRNIDSSWIDLQGATVNIQKKSSTVRGG